MNKLQDMTHQSFLNPHIPPPPAQIQANYQKSKNKQNRYQFPRKKQSLALSDASQELEHAQFYNLYRQNRNNRVQEHTRYQSHQRTGDNKLQQFDKTKILELKKIKQYTKRQSMLKKQKVKVVSRQVSPDNTASMIKIKKIDLIPQKNILITPTKKQIQSKIDSKTKSHSKSKKKILVMSAHKLRKIQNFKFQSAPTSPHKGIHLVSKAKQYGTQIRSINIF